MPSPSKHSRLPTKGWISLSRLARGKGWKPLVQDSPGGSGASRGIGLLTGPRSAMHPFWLRLAAVPFGVLRLLTNGPDQLTRMVVARTRRAMGVLVRPTTLARRSWDFLRPEYIYRM